MTSIMRRTVRGMAAGLGALAIVAGAAACGGLTGGDEPETGGDEPTVEQEQPAAEEQPTEEPAAEEEPATAEESTEQDATESDEAAAGAGGEAAPIDEAALTAAGDRFMEFIQVLDDGDGEAACGFFIDPTTDEPASGEFLAQCGEALAPQMESLEPGSMDVIDRSMVETADNGDGTVSVSMAGSDFPYPMVQGADGQWYMSLS